MTPSTPLPEQGGFNEKLDKILRKHGAGEGELTYSLKADIRTLIAEGIIGEDEKTYQLGSPEWNFVGGQNALRAEQRKKLGFTANKEDGGDYET